MIVPSIDLIKGEAVQLEEGKELKINAGNPRPIAKEFSRVGEIAVIDLDAAMSKETTNEYAILDLIKIAKCRVGGGIRSTERAKFWLDAGASKIILGTQAVPEILSELPKSRVIAAVDAYNGEVVVEGWEKKTGANFLERIKELREYVDGFLVTFVEREGKMSGVNFDSVKQVIEAAGSAKVTIAGGITTEEEIAKLDSMGADAQVGMAIYSGKLDLSRAFLAPVLANTKDSLIPTVVSDERGQVLGFVYSNPESVKEAISQGKGIYFSRKRGLWEKGKESGNFQDLLSISADCDRDSIKFKVRQHGNGFCHLETRSCFGEDYDISSLERVLKSRVVNPPEGSYTKRLLTEERLLEYKILEEAREFVEALSENNPKSILEEACDVFYFSLVALVRSGLEIADLEKELERRSLKISRRPGNAKSSTTKTIKH